MTEDFKRMERSQSLLMAIHTLTNEGWGYYGMDNGFFRFINNHAERIKFTRAELLETTFEPIFTDDQFNKLCGE